MIVHSHSPTHCHSKIAEREGFEPSVLLHTHAFQACSIGHSDISPKMVFANNGRQIYGILRSMKACLWPTNSWWSRGISKCRSAL
ncbi:MAG: hypothetical protein RL204_2239 [Bacteroidota bacterium]